MWCNIENLGLSQTSWPPRIRIIHRQTPQGFSVDNAYASCNGTCTGSRAGTISNFGFSVPSGATINGIGVQVVYNCSSACTRGNYAGLGVALSWNNGTNYTSIKTATTTSTTNITQTLGGSSDTWGRTWASGDFSTSNFKLQLSSANSHGTVNLDQLQVQVYYTTSGGISTSTTLRFVDPDNLGSTNVVSDQNQNQVQALDYLPFGAVRSNTSVGGANSARQYIGQFADNSGLSYLNARYYDAARGQFLSEDPGVLSSAFGKQSVTVADQLSVPKTALSAVTVNL